MTSNTVSLFLRTSIYASALFTTVYGISLLATFIRRLPSCSPVGDLGLMVTCDSSFLESFYEIGFWVAVITLNSYGTSLLLVLLSVYVSARNWMVLKNVSAQNVSGLKMLIAATFVFSAVVIGLVVRFVVFDM